MDISSTLGLPPVARQKLNSEVDFYGLSSIVSKKLGLRGVPRSFATWRHGWIFMPLRYVAQLVWTDRDAPFHLVATEKEAAFLSDQGVENAVAVGLPFIYADLDGVARIPGSLLVMPPHSLSYADTGMDEAGYINYIKGLSRSFSKVVFCLHQDCLEKRAWCDSLEEAGFDYVAGASAHDPNSLARMQKLFRSFEYMTTCTMGSHLVYGAYCGCKVSIAGGFFEYKRENLQNVPFYRQFPELLTYNLEQSSESAVRTRYPFLFVSPAEAEPLVDWAYEEVGGACRRDLKELKKYLGWNLWDQVRNRAALLKKKVVKCLSVGRDKG